MTDKRGIIKLGLQTGAGSSHGNGKTPFMIGSIRFNSIHHILFASPLGEISS